MKQKTIRYRGVLKLHPLSTRDGLPRNMGPGTYGGPTYVVDHWVRVKKKQK